MLFRSLAYKGLLELLVSKQDWEALVPCLDSIMPLVPYDDIESLQCQHEAYIH